MRSLKVKVVGDSTVGKTSLLSRWYHENYAPENENQMLCKKAPLPPVLESFFINTTVDSEAFIVTYWDTFTARTIHDMDLIKVKPLEYEHIDVFIACFDISNPASFQNVSTVWIPEIRYYAAGVPVLVVGNKLDLRTNHSFGNQTISASKGIELAGRLETEYFETSSLTGQGIDEMIARALSKAVVWTNRIDNKTPKRKMGRFQSFTQPLKTFYKTVEPPSLPHQAPEDIKITVPPSSYSSNMSSLLSTGCCADLVLQLKDCNITLHLHKIMFCIASPLLKDLLVTDAFPTDHLTALLVQKNQAKSPVATFDAIKHFLDFLYTFEFKLDQDSNQLLITKVLEIAEIIQLESLAECCRNVLNKQEYLNRRECELADQKRKQTARELFVNKSFFSDVTFVVEGTRVYAHKAIVMARSDVMSAMLGGGFKESVANKEIPIEETTKRAFVDLLDYLYTDSLPDNSRDYRQLLILSDRFCLPRLRALCEMAISNQLKVEIRKKLHLSSETCRLVIDYLLLAEAHNATQLCKWCNYIITIYFSDFESHEDLRLLKPEDRERLDKNRWPPASYLKELEEYKRKTNK